jgi:hypothetical protein
MTGPAVCGDQLGEPGDLSGRAGSGNDGGPRWQKASRPESLFVAGGSAAFGRLSRACVMSPFSQLIFDANGFRVR